MIEGKVKIGAVGDLHYDVRSAGRYSSLFRKVHEHVDILVLCGDLTDFGLEEEAQLLADDVGEARVPVLAVLGNHDHEGNQPEVVERILRKAGVRVLDGEDVVVRGVGFAGAKGFGGGFGAYSLDPWGERIIKEFVQASLDEVLKLERALGRLHTPAKVVITHYSPIAGTLRGEPKDIWAFLGTSRLEEVIDRYGASVAVHGHAHHGVPEGRTRGGIPVFNCALPVLKRSQEWPFLRIFEVPGEVRSDQRVQDTENVDNG